MVSQAVSALTSGQGLGGSVAVDTGQGDAFAVSAGEPQDRCAAQW